MKNGRRKRVVHKGKEIMGCGTSGSLRWPQIKNTMLNSLVIVSYGITYFTKTRGMGLPYGENSIILTSTTFG